MIDLTQLNRDRGSCSTVKECRVLLDDYSVPKSPAPRSRKALGAIAALTAGLFACSGAARERAEKARTTEDGPPLAVLISKAGPPSVDRGIYRDHPGDPCADDKRSVRGFEYHVPFDSVSGPVRKLFGRTTVTSMTVVGVDAESKVTSTHSPKF